MLRTGCSVLVGPRACCGGGECGGAGGGARVWLLVRAGITLSCASLATRPMQTERHDTQNAWPSHLRGLKPAVWIAYRIFNQGSDVDSRRSIPPVVPLQTDTSQLRPKPLGMAVPRQEMVTLPLPQALRQKLLSAGLRTMADLEVCRLDQTSEGACPPTAAACRSAVNLTHLLRCCAAQRASSARKRPTVWANSCTGGRTPQARCLAPCALRGPPALPASSAGNASSKHATDACRVRGEHLCNAAGACLASELPMQSVPSNSIVSFSADMDRLFGFGFPLGQVTELCALQCLCCFNVRLPLRCCCCGWLLMPCISCMMCAQVGLLEWGSHR